MSDDEASQDGPPLGRMVPVNIHCAIHDGISQEGERFEVPMSDVIDTHYLSLAISNKHGLPRTLMPSIDSVVHTFREADAQANQDEEDQRALDPRSTARSRTGAMAWANLLSKAHASYRLPQKLQEEHDFAAVYHESIHSPALFTLLQLEHTYGINVAELVEQRNRTLEMLTAQQVKEMDSASSAKKVSDIELSRLAHRHMRAMEAKQKAFRQDIQQLKAMQKNDYHEYVRQLFHAEQSAPAAESPKRWKNNFDDEPARADESRTGVSTLKKVGSLFSRGGASKSNEDAQRNLSRVPSGPTSPQPIQLEESFTVHLGTQKKTSHNLRLKAADMFDLCHRDPTADFEETQAERLGTAMALYSTNALKAIVHLVDNNFSHDPDDFTRVCETSTEFHFEAFEDQLQQIRADIGASLGDGADGRRNANDSIMLNAGDVYITKHSNLSGYHIVFHLVCNTELQEGDLNTRSPVIAGLRSALRTAFQYGISEVSVPLLMLDHITEAMTPKWQLRRAELILKCAKGFILENSVSGMSKSKTVEFLVPKETDIELFDAFSGMVSNIFRVAGTMNLS